MSVEIKTILKQLSEAAGVTGYEKDVRDLVIEILEPLVDDIRTDTLGNVVALKRGTNSASGSIMLAAHIDEIGLIVTKLDESFLRSTQVGGIDERVLLGQEVLVHGREPLPGVIASRPPHVSSASERRKSVAMDELLIDVGLSASELAEMVQVGDMITIKRDMIELQNNCVAGKAMDDRACVVAIIAALNALYNVEHEWDVYAVATVQEEIGVRGATTSTYNINPHIGIALDVTHAKQYSTNSTSDPGLPHLGKGSVIAFGPNIHPKLFDKLVKVAEKNEIPYQIEPDPGPTGTDARAIQVTRSGIPTALLSLPLRYMHTAVETISLKDIERTARLLASFITELDTNSMDTLRLE